MASSSVGGSCRTRLRPYFVFQSSPISTSLRGQKQVRVGMLQCNIKFCKATQPCAWTSEFVEAGRVVKLDRGRSGGEALQRPDELARGRHREMRHQSRAVGP